MLLSSSAEPNNVPVLTERPSKTGSTASDIVCATQWQSATQADKGGFELAVIYGSMTAAVKLLFMHFADIWR